MENQRKNKLCTADLRRKQLLQHLQTSSITGECSPSLKAFLGQPMDTTEISPILSNSETALSPQNEEFLPDIDFPERSQDCIPPQGISPEAVDKELSLALSTPTITDFPLVLDETLATPKANGTPTAKCLPFPLLPRQWYENQQRLAEANKARTQSRESIAKEVEEEQNVVVCNRISGTLQANKDTLSHQCKLATSPGQAKHLEALIQVATYLERHGPLILSQDVAKVYCQLKSIGSITSASLYEILSKYLNLTQVYVNGKVYLVTGCGDAARTLLHTIATTVNQTKIINAHVKDKISDTYAASLQYLDSARDREVLRGIIGTLTSVKLAASLEGRKSRFATRNAVNNLGSRLHDFRGIWMTSQVVRNNLTNQQQHALTRRIVNALKHKEIRLISEGRGRALKAHVSTISCSSAVCLWGTGH